MIYKMKGFSVEMVTESSEPKTNNKRLVEVAVPTYEDAATTAKQVLAEQGITVKEVTQTKKTQAEVYVRIPEIPKFKEEREDDK